ncbi:MAG: hypothetical protein J5707_03705, partial [Candidatus Methanomethylophilus sp.]|nr:hypothetical protein [Methanomethylophilus sp.]
MSDAQQKLIEGEAAPAEPVKPKRTRKSTAEGGAKKPSNAKELYGQIVESNTAVMNVIGEMKESNGLVAARLLEFEDKMERLTNETIFISQRLNDFQGDI